MELPCNTDITLCLRDDWASCGQWRPWCNTLSWYLECGSACVMETWDKPVSWEWLSEGMLLVPQMNKDKIVLGIHRCVFVCVCVLSLIPPHTLDRHWMLTPLFVQCIHCGSYYGSHMNSSLSTSSDLLSPLFLLSLSPGVSSLLLLFLSYFIIYAALFSPCSPHFLISFLDCNHALLAGVLFRNECLPLATRWTVPCHCVFPIDSN